MGGATGGSACSCTQTAARMYARALASSPPVLIPNDVGARGARSDEDRSPRKKKEKKKKEKKKKEKKKRGREEKESRPKKRKKRSGGSDEGSEGGASDAEASKEKRVFEESDDDAELRDEGIDLETGEVVASKGKAGPGMKLSKKEMRERRERELLRFTKFINDLKKAALEDRNAYKERKTATSKLEKLEQLRTELMKKRTQQDYMEMGILKSLKLWLDPLDHEAKTFKARVRTRARERTHTCTHTCTHTYTHTHMHTHTHTHTHEEIL